jgi:PIN domain nuclease of toxin-antitoxin system
MILLDTHIWVRWLDPEANPLPREIIDCIELADQLAVSAISCWEVAWLQKRGRLQVTMPYTEWLQLALHGSSVQCLPIDQEIAVTAANLAEHHRDPADRFIIATALQYQARIVSLDATFQSYGELTGLLISK